MHQAAFDYCGEAVSRIAKITGEEVTGKNIIDIGGRNVNGSIHQFFGDSAINIVDIMDGDGVDHVLDFSIEGLVDTLTFKNKFDIAISTEVLEHSPDWRNIVANMVDCVKPDGWILITCATTGRRPHSAIDGHWLSPDEDEYYGNVDYQDFINAISFLDVGVVSIEHNREACDLYALLRKE